jgi:hypothetical protein
MEHSFYLKKNQRQGMDIFQRLHHEILPTPFHNLSAENSVWFSSYPIPGRECSGGFATPNQLGCWLTVRAQTSQECSPPLFALWHALVPATYHCSGTYQKRQTRRSCSRFPGIKPSSSTSLLSDHGIAWRYDAMTARSLEFPGLLHARIDHRRPAVGVRTRRPASPESTLRRSDG